MGVSVALCKGFSIENNSDLEGYVKLRQNLMMSSQLHINPLSWCQIFVINQHGQEKIVVKPGRPISKLENYISSYAI